MASVARWRAPRAGIRWTTICTSASRSSACWCRSRRPQGIENLRARLLTRPAVDGVFFGPSDLAASMGLLGRSGDPIGSSCRRGGHSRIVMGAGKAAGVLTVDVGGRAPLPRSRARVSLPWGSTPHCWCRVGPASSLQIFADLRHGSQRRQRCCRTQALYRWAMGRRRRKRCAPSRHQSCDPRDARRPFPRWVRPRRGAAIDAASVSVSVVGCAEPRRIAAVILRRWFDLMMAHQDDLARDPDCRAGQAARGGARRDRLRRVVPGMVRRRRQAPLRRSPSAASERTSGCW